jgi:excisionase family DNA binding protein
MESMMTARQVAELLGVHENWVYDQAASGELPSYKIGGTRRFDRDELRGWIAEHREAERRPQTQQRNVREVTAPGRAGRWVARRKDDAPEPERSNRSSQRTDRQRSNDCGEAQTRLFET